ncbi:MAG: hypothetical protein KGL95_02680, partial [Patescibacteria group bacterium]|nr:hypothetical protein [Patescibacteria group bacterium]
SGSAFQLIRAFETTCDGRMAWITLCRFYESAGVTSTAKIEAHNTIMTLTYGGASRKNGTFADYVSKHIGAAATLERLHQRGSEGMLGVILLRILALSC